MNVLLLKKFNNYFNRIIVKYDTLAKYQEGTDSYVAYTGINFNYNDGIITEIIIGSEGQQISGSPIDWDETGSPDYLVCYDTVNNTDTIKSRWFVTESQKTRLGQYRLVLKRDSIADHMDEVTSATSFIEKGTVTDINDSAVYNKEEITTNQIKSDEFLLKDETQCGWVVGYVAQQNTTVDSDGHIVVNDTSFTAQDIPGVEANDSLCDEIYANETEFYAAHPELEGVLASLNRWDASVTLDVKYGKFLSSYWVGQTLTMSNTGNVTYAETAYKNRAYLYAGPVASWYVWKEYLRDWRDETANNFLAK